MSNILSQSLSISRTDQARSLSTVDDRIKEEVLRHNTYLSLIYGSGEVDRGVRVVPFSGGITFTSFVE